MSESPEFTGTISDVRVTRGAAVYGKRPLRIKHYPSLGCAAGEPAHITNQLLDFQKMENGALQLNLVSCDIKEIVNDVYSQFTSPAELKGIELVLTLPEQELVSMVVCWIRPRSSSILVTVWVTWW
jgi:signal transduction histidine kinase